MATYLEQYCNGEYKLVWDELIKCGINVRQDHIYPDALAVAQETMRRIRHNIEELIERLGSMGFIFGYDHLLLSQVRLSRNPIERRKYLEMLDWSREQAPVFLSAKQLEEERSELDLLDHPFHFDEDEQALHESRPLLMKQYIDEVEQLIGPVPLSVHAWYEEVGAVNFYGFHPRWDALLRSLNPAIANDTRTFLMSSSDPLQVCALDRHKMADLYRQYKQHPLVTFAFAAGCYGKDYCSGSSSPYIVSFPDSCADAVLFLNQPISFVEYLRTCILKWAGFPGMAQWKEVPKEDLAFLTQDLLPF